MRKHLEK